MKFYKLTSAVYLNLIFFFLLTFSLLDFHIMFLCSEYRLNSTVCRRYFTTWKNRYFFYL